MLEKDEVQMMFTQGINCAMQVFGAIAPRLGLERETAYRIAAAYGGGMGQGGPCGAVCGALMALGLACGNDQPGDMNARKAFFAKQTEFKQEFLQRFPGLSCIEVLGCDLRQAEGKRKMLEENLLETVCTTAVCAAVEIVEEILELD
ncbi:MAG: C-GCAxxG-C-C family protein [Bacillota bacterium]|nr:C-GCAxxG-C-C family protein [Bacillota bacterium]